jgi:hypothetical protein
MNELPPTVPVPYGAARVVGPSLPVCRLAPESRLIIVKKDLFASREGDPVEELLNSTAYR